MFGRTKKRTPFPTYRPGMDGPAFLASLPAEWMASVDPALIAQVEAMSAEDIQQMAEGGAGGTSSTRTFAQIFGPTFRQGAADGLGDGFSD